MQHFEQLHRAEESAVFRYILDRVGDYETAQDLTVETFVQTYRCWNQFQENPVIPAQEWVYLIAKTACDHWEQRGRPPGEEM